MPGRIMEDESINGSHTNHERDKRLNGFSGASNGNVLGVEKGKSWSEPQAAMANSIEKMTPNGSSDDFERDATTERISGIEEVPRDLISQLPPELLHISVGYLPLSSLLTRLTGHTLNVMERTAPELARMPTPASTVNGNATHLPNGGDDMTLESINKKMKLMDFAQDTYTKFAKAVVLTQWSEKSEDVSKVIDLRVHLVNQMQLYSKAFEKMAGLKRDLGYMRVRNPDLKTAVEVLSTGKCSWMPDFGYIEPPPLTAKEILQTLKNLNTLLSIRMNLHDYDKLPYHFKNYSIKSGRITFHVAGEFELDLTIADENPEAQLYFIDFRFLFTPRMSHIPEAILFPLENRVNSILAQDDPLGACYKFLHEVVLTQKIAEIKKQAYDLNQGKWVGTLVIEPLQRALCIQYWHGRYANAKGPKSWIIIGINSGKRKDGKFDAKATSRIGLRWFRDAKEVEDINIPLDLDQISTETLLKTVIATHVEHILTSTHEKLMDVPVYKNRDLAIEMSISHTEPSESIIKLQATHKETLTVAIEPITGRITISPASHFSTKAEVNINNRMTDPAKELADLLMEFRPQLVYQEIVRKCVSAGWENVNNPGFRMDDIRGFFRKDTQMACWLKTHGWKPEWFVAVGISTSGEEWKLIETAGLKRPAPVVSTKGKSVRDISTVKLKSQFPMPMTAVSPIPSYDFFGTLHIYAAAQISHIIDINALSERSVKHSLKDNTASVNTTSVKLPKILVSLKGLNPQQKDEKPWATDMVELTFSGIKTRAKRTAIEPRPTAEVNLSAAARPSAANPAPGTPTPIQPRTHFDESCVIINQASVIVPSCKNLQLLGEHVDKDIGFQASTGKFTIKLSTPFGQSSIPALQTRLRDVERLVKFVEVMDNQKPRYSCESISLNRIVFSYKSGDFATNEEGVVEADRADSGDKGVTYRATVSVGPTPKAEMTVGFEDGNPHIRMEDIFNAALRQSGLHSMLDGLTRNLALLTACDTIEKSWSELTDKVVVSVNVRSLSMCHLVYRFVGIAKHNQSRSAQNPKFVRLEISFQTKGTKDFWWVKRLRIDDEDPSPDEIDEALRAVWCNLGKDKAKPWKGLDISAGADIPVVGSLLLTIDKIFKEYVNRKEESEGKDKESKNVVAKEEKQGPMFGSGIVNGQGHPPQQQHQPQQQQRGVAPQAPMMAPMMTSRPSMQPRMNTQQRMNISPAQRQAYTQELMRHQRDQQHSVARQQRERQDEEREVITLDD